jgi:hypothetical protein
VHIYTYLQSKLELYKKTDPFNRMLITGINAEAKTIPLNDIGICDWFMKYKLSHTSNFRNFSDIVNSD